MLESGSARVRARRVEGAHMANDLKPAAELAAEASKPYPNDSAEYRRARTALLAERSSCAAGSSASPRDAPKLAYPADA